MKTLYTTYNNFAKRLVMSLIVLMTVGVGSVLGETVTFEPSDFSGQGTSGTGSSISATKDGVTFSCDKGYGTTQFRCYKDGKITISSSKTISSISFSFSGSYTGGLETSYTELNTYSWEESLSSQARITSCTVIYTTSGGGDDDDSGCITLSTTQNYPFNSTSSSNTNVHSTEIDGVTFENKGGYKYNSYLSFNRSLSGAYLANTTAFSGNIESIVVNYNTGGTTYFTMYEGSSSLPSSTIVSPSKTGTGEVTYTFSGNNAYFKLALTTTGQYCNISSITICYSTAPETYTVTYNANGAESGDVPTDPNEYASGVAVTVLGNTGNLVKTGYRFDGWQINKSGTVYNAGGTFNISENTTLYAKWTERQLTNYRTSCGSAATLVSIAVSGQTTTYNVGDSFSFDGTCTATYDDESTKTVTPTRVSSPDMSTAGTKTVTVTYTEGDVTVTTEYDITVNVVKTATSLTWSADSYTATIASPSNLFPTLKVNPEAIKGSVTYSSSHPEYATIDAAGNIRLLAAGTTTITASYAGDEDYAAAEDTYTLIVEESDNCRWEEVTNLNDIATGDEVVITMSKGNYVWTISNVKNTESAPNATDASANVEGQYLTTVNDGNKWVIEKNNDNLTFYSYTDQANYLYCINDDNGVRVGTGSAKVFVVDGNYLKNTQTTSARYVGVSENTNPYSWRCYTNTTGVIKDQTLKLYKKVCLPSNVSRVTYSVGEGDTAPAEQEVENNTSITLPSITTNLTCVNFVGWTDAASGYTHGTDNLYKAGDNYTVTGNVTLHAVYAAGGGYVLVTDVANLAVGDKVIIVAANSDAAMGADRGSNRGQVEVTKDGNTISNIGESQILTLEAGKKSETFAFNTGSGYLYAASSSSNHLKTQATNNDNGSWKITIDNTGVATIKAQGTYTRNWLRYNGGNTPPIFSCYASGQSDVSIYKEDVAGYTTTPACVTYEVTTCTPTNGTISVDKTTVDPYGSATVTFAPASGYMLQAVTVTSGTAIVGAPSYTTSQISGGTVTISNIQSDIEVCATFVEIPYYKVTFVDMNNGNSTQIVSQSGFGADIQAPTTASDGCDATWTFIGWAPNNSLNGASEIPNGLVAPGGTISGSLITDNSLTYYSVYSNSSDGTPPFSIGKSGTYYFKAITENSDVYYATGEFTGSDRYNTNSTPNIPFLLTYNSTTGKYTIKNTLSDKYLAPDSYEENDLTEQDASYGWDVIQPTLYADKGTNAQAKTGEYLFCYTKSDGTSVRYLYCNGSYFDSWARDNSKYALYLEPASEMRYYNASSCTELVTMTFDVPADAELTYENGYPEGYYKDSEKKNVSTFPTLTYDGWTFIGWTAGASYNDQIGDENLDDENSSPNAPSETIYKTGGVSYYLGADVTMYPVFTKYEDNEDINLGSGGEYYMYFYREGDYYKDNYFGADNHYQRMYASAGGGDNGEFGYTTNCNNAQIFEFIKEGDGWNIRVKNADGSYPTKSYLVNTTGNDYDLVSTKPSSKWSITKEPEGDYTMWYKGNATNQTTPGFYVAKAHEYSGGSSWNFKCYNKDNDASQFYYKVYLGTCENRVFSSNPSNKPAITLSGEPIVTSTQDQSIRAQGELSISATKLAANGTITLTSDNEDVYFSTVKDANFTQATKPVTPLTLKADEKGKLAMTTIYVHYKPTSTSSLGVQTANITATTGTNGQPDYATATTTAAVRNLPTNFVIAAKWDGHWYALPANCTSSLSSTEGLLIEVNDMENPTMATSAPASAKFGLKSVYTSNSNNDRYEKNGANLVFVENVTEETPIANQTLYNGSETGIQVYAKYANYHTGNALRYEWTPTTTNLLDYTLTSAHTFTKTDGTPEEARTISLGNNGVFGTLLNDKSYNGEVRLLPATFYEPAPVQVLKWKANSVIVMYTGAETTATTQVGNNDKSAEQALANQQLTHGIYELTTNQALTNNAGGVLKLNFGANTRVELEIPLIISGEVTASVNAHDVVILENSKLTAAETKYSYKDVYVYGGGKLAIPDGTALGVNNIILRAGGVATDGAGQNATYQYIYPQVELKGTLTSSVQNIRYEYVTDYDHWYHLALPFDGSLASIHYPYEYYGDQVKLDNTGSWQIKRYDGATRATGNYDAWKDIEKDEPTVTTVTAGKGYIYWGAPKKITANDVYDRPTWGIQRITMLSAASETIAKATAAENANKTISGLSSYANVPDNSKKDNDQGWNLVGNPYMVNLTGLNSQSLQIGQLIHDTDASGNWTGKWHWDDTSEQTGLRYVTIPSDHFETYEAKLMTWFTESNPMIAGRSFFVQIAGAATDLVFDVTKKAALMPALLAENNDKPVDIETGIILSNETMQDEVNFWIKDGKTNNYEYNADYPKTPNNNHFNIYGVHTNGDLSWVATSPEYAAQSMPIGYQVPAAGTYTLSVSETYYSENLQALFVTDHEASPEVTTNLVDEDYTFYVNQAETNNTRFTVSIILKPDKENTPTGVDNINTKANQPIKFLYQDKIYILRNGMIYDTTGKQVITINK